MLQLVRDFCHALLDSELATPTGSKTTLKPLIPLRYAFPYDALTIEELDKAAASTLLSTGESHEVNTDSDAE